MACRLRSAPNRLEAGTCRRLCLAVPPHTKSEVTKPSFNKNRGGQVRDSVEL